MKEGQKFRRGHNYTKSGQEHRSDCRCGCLPFENFLEKQFPGMLENRIVRGKSVKVGTR
jgi:hypothetical protein